jgi:amino acid transporter
MSGDLKHPSKAIPKGTLSGLALTFVSYTLVILAMAATITRPSLRANTNVIQLVGCNSHFPTHLIISRQTCQVLSSWRESLRRQRSLY